MASKYTNNKQPMQCVFKQRSGRPKRYQQEAIPMKKQYISTNCVCIIQAIMMYTKKVNKLIGSKRIVAGFPYQVTDDDARINNQEMSTLNPKYQLFKNNFNYIAPPSLITQFCQICNEAANKLEFHNNFQEIVSSLIKHYEDTSLLPGLRYKNSKSGVSLPNDKAGEIQQEFKQFLKQLIKCIVHQYNGQDGQLTEYYKQIEIEMQNDSKRARQLDQDCEDTPKKKRKLK